MSEPFRIYCAVYCWLWRGDTVFLMRRANTGYRDGYWGLTGGHVELGESLLEAVIREMREETGLILEPSKLILKHAMYRRSDRTYADYFFECREWVGDPKITELDKCDGAEWFDLTSLPEKTPSEIQQVAQCLLKNISFSEITTPGREQGEK